METNHLKTLVRKLRRTALGKETWELTDGQLLERFLSHKDESAFEMLLRRHGPMVLGVCRRLLGNCHDAEDAFQATFLVLVRKGSTVRPRDQVAKWLYGVAYRTALHARAAGLRRREKERLASATSEPQAAAAQVEPDWLPLLDRALNALPEKYRVPVVLCELEGRSRKEVARQLRIPEGTLSSRLAMARRMLALALTRHGVALSAGALTAALARDAEAAIPAALWSLTHQAAVGNLATGKLAPSVAVLVKGVLHTMFMSRFRSGTALVGLILLVVTGLGIIAVAQPNPSSAPVSPGGLEGRAAAREPDRTAASSPVPKKVTLFRQFEQAWWALASADATGQTITVVAAHAFVTPGEGTRNPEGIFSGYDLRLRNLPVAADARIHLDGKTARLADLRGALNLRLTMADGKPEVTRIDARSTERDYILQSVDVRKSLVRVVVQDAYTIGLPRPQCEDLQVAGDAKIWMDGRPARLRDLRRETHIHIRRAPDKPESVVGISTNPVEWGFTLEGVDARKKTIDLKIGPGDLTLEGLRLAADAKIILHNSGAAERIVPLADLQPGMWANVELSFAGDQALVQRIRAASH